MGLTLWPVCNSGRHQVNCRRRRRSAASTSAPAQRSKRSASPSTRLTELVPVLGGLRHTGHVRAEAPGVRALVPGTSMNLRVVSLLVFLLTPGVGSPGGQPSSTHGPARGALVLQGGVGLNPAINSAFVALAGGPASHVVVIPTASVFDAGPPGMATNLARRIKESFGVGAVTVLHSLDRVTSDSDSFVDPLRKATGVWLLGGMPERLVQAYLGTKTERAIKDLLNRGGVVGGESAGAMIQGCWLDTTDSESFTPTIQALIRAHGTGAGFGLLTHSAVFPHFDKRGPEAAVHESAAHPDQLAIGIDEETALVVRGDEAQVVGLGTVSLYDGAGRGAPTVVVLKAGERYDLAARRRR